jgi:hypothetical protein
MNNDIVERLNKRIKEIVIEVNSWNDPNSVIPGLVEDVALLREAATEIESLTICLNVYSASTCKTTN